MGALSGLAGRRRRLLPAALVLLLISALAGAVATAGAALASRGLTVQSRAPAWARIYALALTRHAEAAAREAAVVEGVSSAQLKRLDEILPDRAREDVDADRLRVIDLEIALDGALEGSLAALRAIPGVVDIVDANAEERGRYTRRRGLVLLGTGIALVALGGAAYALGVAGAAGIAARECRDEIAVRHLLGSDPGRLWGPFALAFGGTAAFGVLATVVVALAAALLLREQGAPAFPPAALGWVAVGGLAWLVGTAALTVVATRQAVLRVAKAAVAIAVLLALLAPAPARADEENDIGRATRELRRVARELAVARQARHRAERRLADSERAMVTGLISADPVVEGLARARLQADASDLERWWRRCEHLRARREDLRARRHVARLGPLIEPRVVPVGGEVAVPFGPPAQRVRTAAFRHGIGLRLGAGETIVAAAPGRVAYAGELAGAGPVVVVDHGRRVYSVYGRIGVALVRRGAKVGSGEPVARAPEHPGLLYFSVRQRGRAIDPLRWIESSESADGVAGTPGEGLERRTEGVEKPLGRG